MLYVCVVPEQTLEFPVMTPGATGIGFTVTASVLAAPAPQALTAAALIVPPTLPAVTLMEVPIAEPLIVQPTGNVHEYDVAPATATMLYKIFVEFAHTETAPVIAPGLAGGAVIVTAKVVAALDPQLLLAVTFILPPEVPAVI
jgi:hypothetical protein